MPTSNFQPIRLLDPGFWYKFTYLMTNSADPDQLASEEANWSGSSLFAQTGHAVFSKRRVKPYSESPLNAKTSYISTQSDQCFAYLLAESLTTVKYVNWRKFHRADCGDAQDDLNLHIWHMLRHLLRDAAPLALKSKTVTSYWQTAQA